MKKRVDSLARIGRLAARMHELGKWRLSAIQQEQASLSDDLRAVFEALESGDLAYGAQAKLSARRIRGLQKKLDTLERESERVQRAAARLRDASQACRSTPPKRRTRPIASMRRARSSPISSSARSCGGTQARGKAAIRIWLRASREARPSPSREKSPED